MPFWKRQCENCRFFEQRDPSQRWGRCSWRPEPVPFWSTPHLAVGAVVGEDRGQDCATFEYQKHHPHPLDNVRAFLARTQVGDVIGLRTYTKVDNYNDISHAEAKVLRHARNHVVVEAFNGHYRIRLSNTQRLGRAGMLIELPEWGVDMDKPVRKAEVAQEHPERAVGMLAQVKVGDQVPLIGYPPMENVRKPGRVTRVTPDKLRIRVGRRTVWMHRKGAVAGIIDGDIWTLDTTEETHAGTQAAATQRQAPAQGHEPVGL